MSRARGDSLPQAPPSGGQKLSPGHYVPLRAPALAQLFLCLLPTPHPCLHPPIAAPLGTSRLLAVLSVQSLKVVNPLL